MRLRTVLKPQRQTTEQICEQYHVEKELASRLRGANREERGKLYSTLYDELYERVPHHPQVKMKADPKARRRKVAAQMRCLSKFLSPEYSFLELGPGDCQLSFEVAKYVEKVYAIDVSERITKNLKQPGNFQLILSGGQSVNVPPRSVNVAYSNAFIEHLHPDDTLEVLQGIYNALIPGGIYICFTPHRFAGPCDVSRYFDNVATGLHLKEYTNTELYRILKSVGFSKVQSYPRIKGICVKFPIYVAIMVEYLINPLPHPVRRRIVMTPLLRNILAVRLIATK